MSKFAPEVAPPVTEELLRALPKTDLHCHLDGSLRLATILELAEKDGVRLPSDTVEGVAKAIHQGATCASPSWRWHTRPRGWWATTWPARRRGTRPRTTRRPFN